TDLKDSEIADLYVALAKAHAQQGRTKKAVASFTEALHLAADPAAKAKIITEAAPLPGLLDKLAVSAPNDGPFEAAVARYFAEQGKKQRADVARTKARAWFEAKLAKEPENSALAAQLAQLLLDKHENEYSGRWAVLKPIEAKSELGATLSILPD